MLVSNCFPPQHSFIDDALNISMSCLGVIMFIYLSFKLYHYFILSRLEKKILKNEIDLQIVPSDNQEDSLVLTELFQKKN